MKIFYFYKTNNKLKYKFRSNVGQSHLKCVKSDFIQQHTKETTLFDK